MPVSSPVPPPRRKKKNIEISNPFDFRHIHHIGADFNPEDVKRALTTKEALAEYSEQSKLQNKSQIAFAGSPQTYVNPSPQHDFHSADSLTGSISTMQFSSIVLADSPPKFAAPIYSEPPVESPHYDHILNWTAEDTPAKHIVNYENFPTSHVYENTKPNGISSKTRRAPSPPQMRKPTVSVTTPDSQTSLCDQSPIWRKEKPTAVVTVLQKPISTPERVERYSVSPAVQRPDRLPGFQIGLDDIIPPPSRTPALSVSNSHSPSSACGTLTKRTKAPPLTKQLAEEAQKIYEYKKTVSSSSDTTMSKGEITNIAEQSTAAEPERITQHVQNEVKILAEKGEKRSNPSDSFYELPRYKSESSTPKSEPSTPKTEPSTPIPKPRTRISKDRKSISGLDDDIAQPEYSGDEDDFLVCRL